MTNEEAKRISYEVAELAPLRRWPGHMLEIVVKRSGEVVKRVPDMKDDDNQFACLRWVRNVYPTLRIVVVLGPDGVITIRCGPPSEYPGGGPPSAFGGPTIAHAAILAVGAAVGKENKDAKQ